MNSFFRRYFPEDNWDAGTGYHREICAGLPPEGRILDLGCGDQTQLAAYRTLRREVWGVDFRQHPRLRHPDWFRLLSPDGCIPFPSATFDLVASSWVLEHVNRPAQFLSEVARVLRPGGRFVALTVNGRHYVSWIARLLHLFPHWVTQEVVRRLYGRPSQDTFPTFYRLNTVRQLNQVARTTGLALDSITSYPNQGYFSFWQPLWHATVVADWCLDRICPGLGRIYMVATLRKPMIESCGGVVPHRRTRMSQAA